MSIPTAHSTVRWKEQRLRREHVDYYARYRAVVELLAEDLERFHRFYEAKQLLIGQEDGTWLLILNTEEDDGTINPPPALITLEFNYSRQTVHLVEITFTKEARLTASL